MRTPRVSRLLPAALALLASVPAHAQAPAAPVLRVVSPWEITSLEPARAGYVFTRMQVAETLLNADDGGLPVPGLAASWTVSDDGLTWQFALRDGATFHDDTPVTAEAAVAALRRAKAQPGPFGTAPVAEIVARDPRTVTIRTAEPYAILPSVLAHSGTQILAPASYEENGQVRRIVGTGPYRITGIEAPLRFEAARNDAWNGGPAPEVARTTYQAVGRSETRALMAESGQAELVFVLDPASQDRLRRSPRIDLRVIASPRTQMLKLNAASPYFDDARARRAISLLIDRDGIARAILRNPQAPATQMFPPGLAEWHVPGLPPLHQDVAEAKRLLAGAGWTPGPGGTLTRGGKPFRVALRTFSDRPELPLVGAALQDQFRDAGIDLQVQVVNSSEIPVGHRDGTLDMALFVRNLVLVPDPVGTLRQDYGPQGGDWGAMGWSNPELTATLTKLATGSDPAQRAPLRGRATTILHDELPVIPIAWYDHSVAVSRRLADVSIDTLDLSYRLNAIRWAK